MPLNKFGGVLGACKDFAEGNQNRCFRGSNCEYLHIAGDSIYRTQMNPNAKEAPICNTFNQPMQRPQAQPFTTQPMQAQVALPRLPATPQILQQAAPTPTTALTNSIEALQVSSSSTATPAIRGLATKKKNGTTTTTNDADYTTAIAPFECNPEGVDEDYAAGLFAATNLMIGRGHAKYLYSNDEGHRAIIVRKEYALEAQTFISKLASMPHGNAKNVLRQVIPTIEAKPYYSFYDFTEKTDDNKEKSTQDTIIATLKGIFGESFNNNNSAPGAKRPRADGPQIFNLGGDDGDSAINIDPPVLPVPIISKAYKTAPALLTAALAISTEQTKAKQEELTKDPNLKTQVSASDLDEFLADAKEIAHSKWSRNGDVATRDTAIARLVLECDAISDAKENFDATLRSYAMQLAHTAVSAPDVFAEAVKRNLRLTCLQQPEKLITLVCLLMIRASAQ